MNDETYLSVEITELENQFVALQKASEQEYNSEAVATY